MRTIGITGGIGSGKSYICRLITGYFDIPVFNCDMEARRLMLTDTALQQRLSAIVGDGLYRTHEADRQAEINKQMLSDFMFVQKRAAEINAIVHPAVKEWFEIWRNTMATTYDTVVMESAILFESGFNTLCNEVWVVTAPLQTRIQRACERDNLSAEQVAARVEAQCSDYERKKTASLVINNAGETDNQLLALLKAHLSISSFYSR